MLYRYAGSPVPPDSPLNFTDADKVSAWARDTVRWAVNQGIINGKGNGILNPTGNATRAEAAQMLKNYKVSFKVFARRAKARLHQCLQR